MAAGLAHELNNPAAAIGRSAAEAREAFREASRRPRNWVLCPSLKDTAFVASLEEGARTAASLDPLEVSDWRMSHVAGGRGVEEGWEISSTLAGAGLTRPGSKSSRCPKKR